MKLKKKYHNVYNSIKNDELNIVNIIILDNTFYLSLFI